MEQTVLTPWQQTALEIVNEKPGLENFYLSGGTALAGYYLKHRFSDDLDFFSFQNPDPIVIEKVATDIAQTLGTTTRFEKLHDRRIFFFVKNKEELKVEFSQYPFNQLEPINFLDGIRVDSLRDVTANKLAALLDRFEPKDFIDLFFLLQETTLEKIVHDTQQKFSLSISPLFLGSELSKVKRIEALPRMIKQLTVEELKSFFTEQAQQLSPRILDE